MKKFSVFGTLALVLSAVPAVALAQNLTNVQTLVSSIGNIVDTLIPIAFAAAVLFFFWGLAKFILAAGSEDAKEEGKRIMIWGIIAIFIMASLYGVIRFFGSAIGINEQGGSIQVPSVSR